MSVIAFSSLKGGVGKTSLSVNIAHASAFCGHSTLLIDLDPSAHATRLFKTKENIGMFPEVSPLAKILLNKKAADAPLVVEVRKKLELVPSGKELRYFIPAQGAKFFAKRFPLLLNELKSHFQKIIIDTPPEFNVLTRTAAAHADLVITPIDSSKMGINSAAELLESADHLKKPIWGLVRTMVNSKAAKTSALSLERLDSLTKRFPAILLNSIISRTEIQNQLTFLSLTAFDRKKAASLAAQYLAVLGEMEDIIRKKNETTDRPSINHSSQQLLAL